MFNDWNFLAFSPLFPVATDILAHFKWLDHQGLVGRCFYNYLRAGKRWNLTSVFGISLDDVSKDGENFFLPLFAGAGCTAQLTQLSLALGCSGRSGWSGPEKKSNTNNDFKNSQKIMKSAKFNVNCGTLQLAFLFFTNTVHRRRFHDCTVHTASAGWTHRTGGAARNVGLKSQKSAIFWNLDETRKLRN